MTRQTKTPSQRAQESLDASFRRLPTRTSSPRPTPYHLATADAEVEAAGKRHLHRAGQRMSAEICRSCDTAIKHRHRRMPLQRLAQPHQRSTP